MNREMCRGMSAETDVMSRESGRDKDRRTEERRNCRKVYKLGCLHSNIHGEEKLGSLGCP